MGVTHRGRRPRWMSTCVIYVLSAGLCIQAFLYYPVIIVIIIIFVIITIFVVIITVSVFIPIIL